MSAISDIYYNRDKTCARTFITRVRSELCQKFIGFVIKNSGVLRGGAAGPLCPPMSIRVKIHIALLIEQNVIKHIISNLCLSIPR